MHAELIFGTGMAIGAGAALLGTASWRGMKKRRGTRVVMYSSQEQARDLAGISPPGTARGPRCLRPELRATERPAQPQQGWSDTGSWVDLGAPQEATVTLLHGDTHRPERCGGVIRFRRRSGEARDG